MIHVFIISSIIWSTEQISTRKEGKKRVEPRLCKNGCVDETQGVMYKKTYVVVGSIWSSAGLLFNAQICSLKRLVYGLFYFALQSLLAWRPKSVCNMMLRMMMMLLPPGQFFRKFVVGRRARRQMIVTTDARANAISVTGTLYQGDIDNDAVNQQRHLMREING